MRNCPEGLTRKVGLEVLINEAIGDGSTAVEELLLLLLLLLPSSLCPPRLAFKLNVGELFLGSISPDMLKMECLLLLLEKLWVNCAALLSVSASSSRRDCSS